MHQMWLQGGSGATGELHANECFTRANKTLPFTNTAFVARDIMSVVDALDEDGMLRYWDEYGGSQTNVDAEQTTRSFLWIGTRSNPCRYVPDNLLLYLVVSVLF
ncbi:hypothetical protein BBP40_004068 [Aspergillus hancockii]|nr:hypothetical protein BBP40_004068 [Aspergillus hancockii]